MATKDNKAQPLNKRRLLEIQNKALNQYLNDMTRIINSMYIKNKSDNDIESVRNRFVLAKNTAPELILKFSGPVVWKNREAMAAGNVEKLLTKDYSEEISEITQKVPENANFDQINKIITKVKGCWHLFNLAERETMRGYFKNLVQHYAEYIKAEQQIKDLPKPAKPQNPDNMPSTGVRPIKLD